MKLLSTIALAVSLACAACDTPPPPAAATPASPAPSALADAPASAVRPFHLITIAGCSRVGAACPPATDALGVTYVVAFGTGAGTTRSRQQASAEVYRELRDRTAFGTHLAARARHLDEGDAGAAPLPDEAPLKTGQPTEGEPLVEAAVELMRLVDREGEVTIDSAPSSGACKVALLPREAPDASTDVERCFLEDEARKKKGTDSRGRGLPF